jgi:pimeloyl-ACP methyl ester carboxylesterase
MAIVPDHTHEDDLVPDADGLVRRSWAIGGAALSALEGGEATDDRETVVLLHGIPTSAELWRDVAVRLVEAGHHVVAFDLPGYGHTLLPSRADHSLAGAAELVATWLRIHVGRGAWLVGHDLGGAVAQILVSRHPTLVSRMTLADTVVEDSWPVAPVRRLQRVARMGAYPLLGALRLVPNGWMQRELHRGFADPSRATDAMLDRVFWDGKVTDDDGRRAFARHLLALDPAQTTTAAGSLGRLPFPTQLVWGARDRFQSVDEVAVRLQALLDEPPLTVLEDAGHFSPVERPDAFARAMLDWSP